MNRLNFSIELEATKAEIWHTLWNEDNYRQWASIFFEGSYIDVKTWNSGSNIHFLGPDKNGIYSLIETHVPNNSITFKHLGNVIDGVEQEIDEATKKWSGATESYSITEGKNNTHTLSIAIDVMDEHLDFMTEKLPLALKKIKEMIR